MHIISAKAKVAQPVTAGVLASSSTQSGGSIKSRLGPKVVEASSTTQSPAPSSVKQSQKSMFVTNHVK